MPELPEVEVVRRGLLPHLKNRKVLGFRWSGKNLRTIVPEGLLRERMTNAVITDVGRRAKYLLLPTDRGDLLIIHLGMTGQLGLFSKGTPDAKHDHLFFILSDNIELRYHDVRRFGAVHLITQEERGEAEISFFQSTGPEPFSDTCTAAYLHHKACGSSQAVKTFLMNGRIIAGIGNIYANESLFAAGIHPATPAGKLSKKQWQLLLNKVREILNWAIECGGSTISDFLNAGGGSGYFQANFRVYGRDGKSCVACSTTLVRQVISGRASVFCPRCQMIR
ncbi:bifunctional DNA-formamidopyrimidine glycosylase/DNA-(apurinic or apyrimidinic site) lyase [Desulfopila inferna]|uniref:bifunctional DNA-formamidopyrimidine glycosylase/DNA-(apurinic or apyrimidinic site) lyase n=1 Tax=Desulfopila inferna TaxID=468528 RepID=UPI001964FAFB|nr:bifunctional DNA-formamidopyrimidine glycosylase/DNA-(apurinic or apyrimidinic site) lyase [Desulfopila inferna]MBM9605157.1 bifunctional DNA-formamidopyrimidine glycosylase/DNA-(apurinic or apyrimidinic site) lyase [Desulfopila inferna]